MVTLDPESVLEGNLIEIVPPPAYEENASKDA
jgi:hypothetical protein